MPATILAVLAHPDDETFGVGGTLALYAARGANVYLVCATRGEAGTVDPKYLDGFASVTELRENELRCASTHLGIKEVYYLGYRDSGMAGTPANQHPEAQIAFPVEEVAGRVVKHIRALRPDAVLTFDPIGGYRHPDHIHIHEATVMAFQKADDDSFFPAAGPGFKPRVLYYILFPRQVLRVLIVVMRLLGKDPRKTGRNRNIDLTAIAAVDFPVHARIAVRPVIGKKDAASKCHASQDGMRMRRGLLGFLLRLFGEHELYMQAYPEVPRGARVKKDLLTLA
jgi:LmbE family N-acetylglucosaminyl deacetylase